jgi:hypothetical protein
MKFEVAMDSVAPVSRLSSGCDSYYPGGQFGLSCEMSVVATDWLVAVGSK